MHQGSERRFLGSVIHKEIQLNESVLQLSNVLVPNMSNLYIATSGSNMKLRTQHHLIHNRGLLVYKEIAMLCSTWVSASKWLDGWQGKQSVPCRIGHNGFRRQMFLLYNLIFQNISYFGAVSATTIGMLFRVMYWKMYRVTTDSATFVNDDSTSNGNMSAVDISWFLTRLMKANESFLLYVASNLLVSFTSLIVIWTVVW